MTATRLSQSQMHLYDEAVTAELQQLVRLESTGKVCFASSQPLLSAKVAEKKGAFLKSTKV